MTAPAKRGPKPGPRIRTLKPEVWQDERLADLSIGARLLYIGTVTQADDYGRQSANPALLRSRIFPFDQVDHEQLDAWLAELETATLIERYTADGRAYLHLTSWEQDQRIEKRCDRSLLPPPPNAPVTSDELSTSTPGTLPEDSRNSPAGPDRTGPEGNYDARTRSVADQLSTALHDVATAKGAAPVTPERIERLLATTPTAAHSAASEAWRDWCLHGTGATKAIKDPLASYRNWINRERRPLTAVPSGPDIDPSIYDRHVQVPA